MNKPFFVLGIVMLVLCALPTAGEHPSAAMATESPSFDVQSVVAQARNRVLAEGPDWVAENARHRVEFSPSGLWYTPKSGGELLNGYAFGYRLEMVWAGRQSYSMASARPIAAGANRVEYARGQGIVEAYLTLDEGVEQLFVLNEPLPDGDLTLVGRVTTTLNAAPDPAGGLCFSDEGQPVVRYGQAVALDAAGASVVVDVRLRGAELTHVVPGEWLASAVYPVTVDPFISADILISRAQDRQSYPAVAYNDDDSEWLVVWQDHRGGDWDIYGQVVDNQGTIQGEVLVISDSNDDLQFPAVDYDTTQERYFVVWQNSTAPAIEGVVINADGSFFSGEVSMTSGTKARTNPDVAYNPISDEYLVVWEYEEAVGNHDIWARKVGVDGVIDPGGTYQISTHAADELTPALIAYPATSASVGRYLLVWSNNNSGTYNIVGRRLLSDGSPTGTTFGISLGTDEGTGNEHRPGLAHDTVSDLVLVAWEYAPASGDRDILGRLIDITQTNPRGTWLAINDASGDQEYPAVTYNAAEGEYLVAWDDTADLFGQRLAPDATLAGNSFAICDESNWQRYGVVAFGADRYLVAWTDYRSGYADILGQRLTQTATLVGEEIGLSPAFDDHEDPVLAYGTQQKQWLVVWRDFHSGNADITGQFVTRDGLLSGEPVEICTHSSHQYNPAVAYNSDDDEFLVVWQDPRNGNEDIYGQRVDAANGNLIDGVISFTTDPDSQLDPALAYNESNDQYLVAWVDKRDDPGDQTDWNIYGRRLNRDGTAFDASDFAICARADNQSDVDVAYNPVQSQYLVVWTDHSLPDGGIAGQRVRGEDPRIAGPNLDICAESTLQRYPSVASGPASGEYFVAWQDNRDGATDINIYGRRVSGSGVPLGTGDVPISTATGNQWRPHVSYDPSTDRYNVFWIDERNSAPNPDIYGQALSSTGELLFTGVDENVPAWVYPGGQTDPAVAIDPADGRGLLVWEDTRNGQSPKIYGRLGEPADLYRIFVPVVFKSQ